MRLTAVRTIGNMLTFKVMNEKQRIDPTIEQAMQWASEQYRAGRLAEAEAMCRKVLETQADQKDALYLLGMIATRAGRREAAVELLGKAVVAAPENAVALHGFGRALLSAGRAGEAIPFLRRFLELQPARAEAHNDLGIAYGSTGNLKEAVIEFRRCAVADPGHADAQSNLGKALLELSRPEEAAAACRECLRLNPRHYNAELVLGAALLARGEIDEAIAACQRAIALHPQAAEAYLNLGNCQKDQGRLDEAIACYRKVVELRPDWPEGQSNLLLALHYQPGIGPQALLAEHRVWQRRHATVRAPDGPVRNGRAFENAPDPERPLKIGYVSGDFREHPIGRFLLPLLEQHDRERYSVHAYANVGRPDGFTEQLRSQTAVWRNIFGVRDEEAAELIRRDGIDILVDLSAHTAHNRLLLFARKPAPVQATYLAYPSTTGLDAMDYRITDPWLDPPGERTDGYAERSVWLPESYWCYLAPPFAPPVRQTPAIENGFVTFGCLNNFVKVSQASLELWRRLLQRTPESRLLLHAPQGERRRELLNWFADEGIESRRIEFFERQAMARYLEAYHRIDVALDPYPFGGGTTTCDALWMGVPVVSLAGLTAVSRAGRSILSNAGLPALVAPSESAYVEIALALTEDLTRLGELRATLRSRMQTSPLMDAVRFTRGLEEAYRKMWRAWCESGPRQSPAS
ncbi:MAG TPA: tetratricopeptide repeat protein [Chthoniobacteraceae bacterium]